ncbi:MAG TPA: biopolymer transporter ExbD [Lentisphaeria bacterium]|nr:biopolymer transporter ExbD [Lentisphaerota bacterium]HQC52074.1 biopolymer transporter ExbD [Lentisphaeria bacterium]HQL88939.1 biopolymer transporter ExbD [Lentisphaeria bacterium]
MPPNTSRRPFKKQAATIDMTPLMDLTFMLLIIFVITVPALEYSTEVDTTPPKLDSEKSTEDVTRPLVIHFNKHGVITIDDNIVALHDLTNYLNNIRQSREKLTVMIRADGSRPYSEVIDILRAARHANVDSASLITQAEDQQQR